MVDILGRFVFILFIFYLESIIVRLGGPGYRTPCSHSSTSSVYVNRLHAKLLMLQDRVLELVDLWSAVACSFAVLSQVVPTHEEGCTTDCVAA